MKSLAADERFRQPATHRRRSPHRCANKPHTKRFELTRVRVGRDDFKDAIEQIVRQALSHLDRSDVLDALAAYICSRIDQYEDSLLGVDEADSLTQADRRNIVDAVLPLLSSDSCFALFCGEPIFIQDDDLEWLLECSDSSESPDMCRKWAELAQNCYLKGPRTNVGPILTCCRSNPIAHEYFAGLIDPVELASERAHKMCEEHGRYLEYEERFHRTRHEPPLMDPPPQDCVEICLTRIEEGNIQWWVRLNRELQLEERRRSYMHDLQVDLMQLPGWEAANEETRLRIIAAAKRYLLEWQSNPDDWIGTRTLYFPDVAGYRALVLIERLEPIFLESLSDDRWAYLAPVILCCPNSSGIGDDSEITQKRLVKAAYLRSPEEIINSLIRIIDGTNANKKALFLSELQRVEHCWDDRMMRAMLEKTRDDSLKPAFVSAILEELICRDYNDAIEYAKTLIPSRMDDRKKAIAKEAARVLWLNMEDHSWDILWPEFQADRTFFQEVITDMAHNRRQFRKPPAKLSEAQLADLYILLMEEFPREEDPIHDDAHFVGPRESVQSYRDGVLSELQARGIRAACTAIERIRDALPHLDYLNWTLRTARRTMLLATWNPLSITQIFELSHQSESRLVRNGRELQEVILESLETLQDRLQGETPAVRDIWDKRGKDDWRPKDEEDFSDYIKRHLDIDLIHCGIVALREVQIRRGNAEPGERTDIYVTAVINGAQPNTFETVRVILEVKGCWNKGLKTAMASQLKDRYLKDNNDCEYGIYVVGWFVCNSWNASDYRLKATPKWTIADAREFFDEQRRECSDEENFIRSFVINGALK
jgi:hypothetical protein